LRLWRLTVTQCSPLSFNARAFCFRSAPLVVSATTLIPGTSTSIFTSVSRSFLTRGSPPLKRIELTPILAVIVDTLAISSKVRTSFWSSQTGVVGMQKSHLKLQRSVTERRSFRAWRPKESASLSESKAWEAGAKNDA
jgi:hypothetical protein